MKIGQISLMQRENEAMIFSTNATGRMRIDSGSGGHCASTSPAEMLHVYHATANVNAIIEIRFRRKRIFSL